MTKLTSNTVSFSDSALTQVGTSEAQVLTWSPTLQEYVPTIRGTNRSQSNTTNYWLNDIVSGLVGGIRTYWRVNTDFISSSSAFNLADFANLDYLSQEIIPQGFLANTLVPTGFQLIQNNSLWQSNSDRITGASFDVTEQTNWTLIAAVRSQELAAWTPSTQYNTGDTVSISLGAQLFYIRKSGFATSGLTFDLTEIAGWRYVSQENIAGFVSNTLTIAGTLITVNGAIHRSATSRITGAAFDSTEQANWTKLTTQITSGSSAQNVAKWNNTTQTWVEGLIVAADITNDTITATQIAPNAITSSELANNSVDTLSIIDANVTLAKLAPNSVDSSKIVDNSILSSDLQQIAANTLIGNPTGALANRQTITLGTNLSFSGTALIPNILEVNPTVFTANGPAIIKQINLINTSAARTISAPASPVINNRFAVVDATGSAATNNITIIFTGVNLYGVANDTFILNVNRASVEFVYTNSTIGWVRL